MYRFLICLLFYLLVSGSVHATNGYLMHGINIQEKAMGGAANTTGFDSLSAASNPATLLDVGSRFDIGMAVFSPFREYRVQGTASKFYASPSQFTFSLGDGDQKIKSKKNHFPVPQFGFTRKIDDNRIWGIAVYGQGGMNTHYRGGTAWLGPNPMPGTFGSGTTGVDLVQLFTTLNYAFRINDKHDAGISLVYVHQRFEARGLMNFAGFSTRPWALSNQGHDHSEGWGVNLGYRYRVSDRMTLGLSVRPQISMSEFHDYSGLFAQKGGFDIPGNIQIGSSWKFERGTLAIEFEQINYSDVDSVGNPVINLFTGCMAGNFTQCLGGSNGAGFGYRDMTVSKIGYEFPASDRLTLRFGFSNTHHPIPQSEILFAVLAPAVMEEHITTGFSYQLNRQTEISGALMYAPSVEHSDYNLLDPMQKITVKMDEYELAFSFSRKF